jgi:hypothetical protein
MWCVTYQQIAEQDKILAARRSNNELDTTKIQAALPDIHIMDIHTSCEKVPTLSPTLSPDCHCTRLEAPSENHSVSLTFLITCPCLFLPQVFQRMRVNLEAEGIWPDKLPKRNTAKMPPSS